MHNLNTCFDVARVNILDAFIWIYLNSQFEIEALKMIELPILTCLVKFKTAIRTIFLALVSFTGR